MRADGPDAKGWIVHSARTAVTSMASLLAARACQLPEAYWAPITTLVITQSSLGAALSVSRQRLVGTVLGAVVGALIATRSGPHLFVFGACIFVIGLLCAVIGSDHSAYRFGGVTLAIVLLIPRTKSPAHVALHRFAEVSIGIGIALLFTILWPESEESTTAG